MRVLALALAAAALPVAAQTDAADRAPRRVVIEVDSVIADGARFEVDVDDADGRRVIIRRRVDGDDTRVVEMRLPDREQIAGMVERMLDGPLSVFRTDDGETTLEQMLDSRHASPETRARMRELEADVRRQAERAREARGPERRRAEAELERTLGEWVDARAQAQREHAAALRERADRLAAEADAIERALDERQARRAELIEARRRAVLERRDADE